MWVKAAIPTCYLSRDESGETETTPPELESSPLSPPCSDAAHSREGTMRNVLLEIANDLSRGIIVEWLEPADVARLDSAHNNRALSRVLRDLLCSPLTLFDVSYSTSYAKLKWAMKRRLNLSNLGSINYPFSSDPEDVWTSIALTTCL